ncbi:MAG: hypothetical protein HC763_12730 [Hydrococcus sp. CRU_1_1]|nr:hypothetical protein [Hydrococcus sp. CRU_1_1]
MAWVDGQPFHEFIEANLNEPLCLQNLARQFTSMSNRLQDIGMAHGDLQHGNILVRDGKLVLIDYDGMYVPGMPYQTSNELGHIAFQHPKRDRSFFNETIDRFSSIAIYISLLCLATSKGPELWRDHHTGENLIFTKQDYKDPRNSSLFAEIQRHLEIESNSKLLRLVDEFQQICLSNLETIPSLDRFLNEQIPILPIPSSPKHFWNELKVLLLEIFKLSKESFQGQHKVFSAHNILQLIEQDGEKVIVVGRVHNMAEYREDLDLIAVFINFGHLKRDSVKRPNRIEYRPFTVVIFSQGLKSLLKIKNLTSIDLKGFEGKYLMVTGLLERVEYKRKYRTPQIILENARQLTSITEEEASRLIAASQKTLWEKFWDLSKRIFKGRVKKERKAAQRL